MQLIICGFIVQGTVLGGVPGKSQQQSTRIGTVLDSVLLSEGLQTECSAFQPFCFSDDGSQAGRAFFGKPDGSKEKHLEVLTWEGVSYKMT